jgi:hypothetical protein
MVVRGRYPPSLTTIGMRSMVLLGQGHLQG